MSDENPYQPPQVSEVRQVLDRDLYVDGLHLIIKSDVRLPPRCVITNQPLPEKDITKQRLRWTGNSFQFMLEAKRGTVFWAVAPWIRRRQRFVILLSLALHASVVGCSIFLMSNPGGFPLSFTAMLVVWIACSFLIQRWNVSTPQVTHYRHGYFWIGGCGKEFLASLESEMQVEAIHFRTLYADAPSSG